jgi:transposase
MATDIRTRRRILKTLERGESASRIATRFEVGERTGYRLQRRKRDGRPVEPDKTGPQDSVKRTEDDEKALLQAVKARPGITAAKALEKIKTKVAESTVCRFWVRSNLSQKKDLEGGRARPARPRAGPVVLDQDPAPIGRGFACIP